MAPLTILSEFSGSDTVSCLSLGEKFISIGFENGLVYVYPLNDPKTPLVLTSPGTCSALSFVGTNLDLLYSSHGGKLELWDLRSPSAPLTVSEISRDEINSIDVHPNNDCLAIADDLGSVYIYSIITTTTERLLKHHENICSCAKFHPQKPDQVISAGFDCRLVFAAWKPGEKSRKVIGVSNLADPSRFVNLLNNSGGGAPRRRKGNKGSVPVRIASSFSPDEAKEIVETRIAGHGLPLNPPMIHSLGVSESGSFITVGTGNGCVEVFSGGETRHIETLLGHKRSVAALLPVKETHLLSGSDDCSLFLWETSCGGRGQEFSHCEKISALAGRDLSCVYMADNTSTVKVVDFSRA